MTRPHAKIARFFKWIGIIIATLIVLVYIGLPAAMGIVTVLPAQSTVGRAPSGFEEVTLQAEDGILLKGWYRPPANETVILLLHGAGGSRESMRSYADMLVQHGYGVLMFDLRGHGESQGQANRLGWQGTLDIGAAVRFLQARSEVKYIGGLGSSVGGEVLLGAASTYPAIRAIAADGATRRCTAEYLALEENRPLVRSFTARVMYATVQLITGSQPPMPLLDSMRAAETTQYLLIAAGHNQLETAFNQRFATTLGKRAELWVAPEADHTGAFALYPEAYEQQIIAFFQAALLNTQHSALP